jgi:uncharacterized protein YndB with AHSA1/START domain
MSFFRPTLGIDDASALRPSVSGAAKQRTMSAPPRRVWEVLSDLHQIPRWWPATKRVEDVREDRWTQVFTTKRGRAVRADFRVVLSEPPWRLCWTQDVAGTPFERVLAESTIEVTLTQADAGTLVTIVQRQKLRGYSRTGGLLLRRATARKLGEALDGLARACG